MGGKCEAVRRSKNGHPKPTAQKEPLRRPPEQDNQPDTPLQDQVPGASPSVFEEDSTFDTNNNEARVSLLTDIATAALAHPFTPTSLLANQLPGAFTAAEVATPVNNTFGTLLSQPPSSLPQVANFAVPRVNPITPLSQSQVPGSSPPFGFDSSVTHGSLTLVNFGTPLQSALPQPLPPTNGQQSYSPGDHTSSSFPTVASLCLRLSGDISDQLAQSFVAGANNVGNTGPSSTPLVTSSALHGGIDLSTLSLGGGRRDSTDSSHTLSAHSAESEWEQISQHDYTSDLEEAGNASTLLDMGSKKKSEGKVKQPAHQQGNVAPQAFFNPFASVEPTQLASSPPRAFFQALADDNTNFAQIVADARAHDRVMKLSAKLDELAEDLYRTSAELREYCESLPQGRGPATPSAVKPKTLDTIKRGIVEVLTEGADKKVLAQLLADQEKMEEEVKKLMSFKEELFAKPGQLSVEAQEDAAGPRQPSSEVVGASPAPVPVEKTIKALANMHNKDVPTHLRPTAREIKAYGEYYLTPFDTELVQLRTLFDNNPLARRCQSLDLLRASVQHFRKEFANASVSAEEGTVSFAKAPVATTSTAQHEATRIDVSTIVAFQPFVTVLGPTQIAALNRILSLSQADLLALTPLQRNLALTIKLTGGPCLYEWMTLEARSSNPAHQRTAEETHNLASRLSATAQATLDMAALQLADLKRHFSLSQMSQTQLSQAKGFVRIMRAHLSSLSAAASVDLKAGNAAPLPSAAEIKSKLCAEEAAGEGKGGAGLKDRVG